MRKFIIGIFIGALTFSGIALVDNLIVKISLASASAIAFSAVGFLYTAGLIVSKSEGGKARFGIFVFLLILLLYVFTQIAKGIIWLFSFPMWLYIVIICGASFGIVLFVTLKEKKTKTEYRQSDFVANSLKELPSKNDIPAVIKPIDSEKKSALFTLPELIYSKPANEKSIKVTRIDSLSPEFEYARVYRIPEFGKPVMGYIKMKNGPAFWGQVYYAFDAVWKKCD